MKNDYLEITEEVKTALDTGKPVVALESTIISHGMPYPKNLETAKKVEQVVRDNGAIPATIAILNGKLKAGLSPDELELLAKDTGVAKVSRRDIPFVLAKKVTGATTVASTMIVANLAGIKVFVTGGIGGVHRGADKDFDISADLTELANTDVAVVCAGVKSILDIGSTLEVLETNGVPVIGFQSEEFPSFYTRKSGFFLHQVTQEPKEIAMSLKAKWDLGLKGGVVVANPIPEQHEMDESVINSAIEQALKEANKKGIKGKDITPFLLARIAEITGAESLKSNIELVFNNARVGALVAKELSRLD